MKIVGIFLFVLAVLGRCTPGAVSGERLPDGAIIRTGTSFGMCAGYCQKDYVLTGVDLTLTTTSNNNPTQYPTKTCQTTISQESWNSLRDLVNPDAFKKIPERLGCPDCADGGAEYIELESGDQRHRVTFEYGKTIPGFESLVSALRSQRERFDECK
ncbi:hypothetical protein [Spirosoma aerophilum]